MIACILQVSDDGRYVLLSIREGCDPVNRLWYCDLETTPEGITGMLCLFICFIFLTCASAVIFVLFFLIYISSCLLLPGQSFVTLFRKSTVLFALVSNYRKIDGFLCYIFILELKLR